MHEKYKELINSAKEEYYSNKGEYPVEPPQSWNSMDVQEWLYTAPAITWTKLGCIIRDLIELEDHGLTKEYDFESEAGEKYRMKHVIANVRIQNALMQSDPATWEVIDILKTFDKDSYIVGGFIRDNVTQQVSNDVDFCTEVLYSDMIDAFKDRGFHVKEAGKQFLVLNVQKNGVNFEIAQLRSDRDNKGAVQGTIYEDAKRRDFTNSALYYNLKTKSIIDPNGDALNACLDNELKYIGEASHRLNEDPLRAIRFYKFIKRGWIPNNKSLRSTRTMWDQCINKVNPGRLLVEVERMAGL